MRTLMRDNTLNNGKAIGSSSELAGVFMKVWDAPTIDKYESAYAIYLDNKNRIIGYELLNIGGRSSCEINYRIAIGTALNLNAWAVAIAHNHPSGIVNPSKADINATDIFKDICNGLEIGFTDHIILSNKQYYSFTDNKLLLQKGNTPWN